MADALDKLSEPSVPQFDSVLAVLRKRKFLIVGLTAVAAVATGFLVSKQIPRYEATASMVVELSVPQYMGSEFRDVVEVEPSWWHSRETLETEFRTLRSYSEAVALAKALCVRTLNGSPALKFILPDTQCKDASDYSRAAETLQGILRVTPLKESRIVELTVSSESPAFAALAANTAAEVYQDQNLERRLSHSAGAATWLGDEYHQLLTELAAAEQALVDFKRKNNVVAVSLEDDQNELSIRRKRLAEALDDVEVKLISLKIRRDQLAAAPAADPMTDLAPALLDNPVGMKLKELYIDEYGKFIAMQGKYGDRHPAITAQEGRLQTIKRDLSRELEIARKGVDAEYQNLTKQATDLRGALDLATKEAIKFDSRTSEYGRLKRDLDRLIKLADQVGGRGRETALASQLKTNNVRIMDPARTPTLPVSPNVPRAITVAAGAALLLSVALAFLLEALDKTIKTQEDVERAVGLTFLGLIPSIDSADQRADVVAPLDPRLSPDSRDLFVLTHPTSAVAECCRAIRTNLLFMTPDKPARTLLITSAGPQEGKTTVAVNMAITMAQSGLRVLLVDTDMRRPRLHIAFNIQPSQGLSSSIVGEAGLMSSVLDTGVPGLYLLPCGPCPPNPAELLHAERFRRSVEELSSAFDRVIFDSPPLGAVTDAAILARLTDATVLVAKGGRTRKDALTRARRQLGSDGQVNVLGCILNDLSLSKQREYGYYYYSRYGYYTQTRSAETPTTAGG